MTEEHGRSAFAFTVQMRARDHPPVCVAISVIPPCTSLRHVPSVSTLTRKNGSCVQVERAGIDGALVDDVIVGCVSQTGAQAGNIGRNMVLASSKVPETVPGTSVDRQCGSSQQAIHFAAQAVMSGVQDVVIAAGVENMSQVPIGSNIADAFKVMTLTNDYLQYRRPWLLNIALGLWHCPRVAAQH